MNNEQTVAQLAKRFRYQDQKAMARFQVALDHAAGVQTIPLLHAAFVSSHRVAKAKATDLRDIMADCVKTAVRKTLSAAVYPIEIAHDGTMTMQPEDVVIKQMSTVDFSNFGPARLGVAVVCETVKPLGFKVIVGPFFELLGMVKAAVWPL